ncbi:MAG: DNA polymerase III subunit delta [Actinomycetota bacterium]
MIRLVWSQDELLASEASEEAAAGLGADAEVVTIDADVSIDGLEEALFAGSLFATTRLVVLRNAQTLNKSSIERLTTALSSEGTPSDLLILAVAERVPTQLMTALKGSAEVVRLARPRRGELIAWVTKRMKRAGLTPGGEAAAALVDAVGETLRDLDQAIEQLALRGSSGSVEKAQIVEHFASSSEQPIWILFDAIVRHEGGKAFDSLRRLFEHGDGPLPVLGALASQIRGVIRVKSLLERTPSLGDRDVASATGMSEGRAAVIRRQSPRLSWDWLLGMHRLLAQADYELKGGEDGAVLPAEIVLERVVAGALDSR